MRVLKIILLLSIWSAVLAPQTGRTQQPANRKAYAAGKFYENNPSLLTTQLQHLFSKTKKQLTDPVLAVISPHAGYTYSGEIAAWGFTQIKPDKKYKNIFILASPHTFRISGASVFRGGNYETPLGDVKVNTPLADSLIQSNPHFVFLPEAHQREHSIENQLPFLQFYLENDFRIVPILIGTDDPTVLASIAKTLFPYLNQDNLFVISTDFAHYPDNKDARIADSLTASGILSNKVAAFDEAIRTNAKMHYPGLVTSACGRTALLTLLNMTVDRAGLNFNPIKYANSGDVPNSDKSRVVGYYSIVLTEKETPQKTDYLRATDKTDLLNIARFTIEEYINKGIVPQLDPEQFSEQLKTNSGAFVTLNKNHRLRGCIGRFFSDQPLYKVVQEMAIAAATQDYRFQKLAPDELPIIDIEISVLTPLKKIQSIDELVLGRDGIYIKKGNQSGTYLPQVADETGWSKEEFLGHCARDKAGIGWDGWKDAELFTYRAIVFSEGEMLKH